MMGDAVALVRVGLCTKAFCTIILRRFRVGIVHVLRRKFVVVLTKCSILPLDIEEKRHDCDIVDGGCSRGQRLAHPSVSCCRAREE